MKRSDRTSITSIALSLRATRIARHSWVNSSMTLSIRYRRPSHALDLLDLQPAKLLTPAIVGHLAHTDLPDRLRHALALRDQNIHLAQLRDHLFGLVSLPCHRSPP